MTTESEESELAPEPQPLGTTAPNPEETERPLVDPQPTAPPIYQDNRSLGEILQQYPAEASPPEVLARKPNRYEDAVSGPDPQISPIVYVHMTKPDGSEFLSPLANADYYERKGFTRGEEETIPDLVAYQAERAQQEPKTNG